MSYRSVTIEDHPQLHALMFRCDERNNFLQRYQDQTLDVVSERWQGDSVWGELLEIDGKLRCFYIATKKPIRAQLNHLFVDPDFWYKGFGKRTFERVCQQMIERKYKVGELFCDKDNYAARALYQSLGCWVEGDPIDIRLRYVFVTEEEVF